MESSNTYALARARQGDIHAFQELFGPLQDMLKSYLHRLTANRKDAEDITHDTFIRAFDHIRDFRGESSFKTWIFRIATNLALTQQARKKRWTEDVKKQAKERVLTDPNLYQELEQVAFQSPEGSFDIREHIGTCFTCMGKTLPVENQVVLMLKDIYDFSILEISNILEKTEGVIKYLLQDARQTLIEIFDRRCALINKEGVCNQCSELNGWFNPKQDQQEARMKLDLVRGSRKYDRQTLYEMRTRLIQGLDPLQGPGSDLQEALLRCNRIVMGEEPGPDANQS